MPGAGAGVCAGGWKEGAGNVRGAGAGARPGCEVAVQEAVPVGTGGAGGRAGFEWQEREAAALREPCGVVLGRAALQAGEQGSVIPGQGRPAFLQPGSTLPGLSCS